MSLLFGNLFDLGGGVDLFDVIGGNLFGEGVPIPPTLNGQAIVGRTLTATTGTREGSVLEFTTIERGVTVLFGEADYVGTPYEIDPGDIGLFFRAVDSWDSGLFTDVSDPIGPVTEGGGAPSGALPGSFADSFVDSFATGFSFINDEED